MKQLTLRHTIHCGEDRFWQVFFDGDYNRELYLGHLGFELFDVLEQSEEPAVRRRLKARPSLNLPPPLAKLFGDGFGYEETGVLDPNNGVWSWTMRPSALAKKLRNEGTMHLEPAGEGRVVRVAELVCEARVFGLSGLIESMNEKELRSGWEKSADFMNRWLKAQPESKDSST
jgi:hypothetical protein